MRRPNQENTLMLRTLILASFLAASLGGAAMAHPWHHHCHWHHHHCR
jgi:hypothetical protein